MAAEETTTQRRTRRPRCLKGQRHRWIMGAALKASDSGVLGGGGGRNRANHLRGECRYCHEVRRFHTFGSNSRHAFGAIVARRSVGRWPITNEIGPC